MGSTIANMVSPEQRALASRGTSGLAIYKMVETALGRRRAYGGCVIDVGCGTGNLYHFLGVKFDRYAGVDLVRYAGLPEEVDFTCSELNSGSIPLPAEMADVVVSVETIEHLENPRAFMRQLVRLAKPGGWVVVTTPNQLSLLSCMTLLLKQRFAAFQDVHYPAHLSALLEVDLLRIGAECGLSDLSVEYSLQGRIVLTAAHYPAFFGKLSPRLFSDNILLIGRRSPVDAPMPVRQNGTH
jgi:SAM-dependent methyltransferase